jgi:hypothetical protein
LRHFFDLDRIDLRMRPKIVILTLLTAFATLGLIALLKGMTEKKRDTGEGQTPAAQTTAVATNDQTATYSSNTVVVSEQLRAAVVAKQIEEIQDLLGQADGSNNPIVINAILDKLTHSEPEVRAAALDALRQLNDTNAIPGLQTAVNTMSDPREKVAVLDTIDYLRLPNITDNASTELATNYAFLNFLATNTARVGHVRGNARPPHKINGQATTSPNGAAGQPQ